MTNTSGFRYADEDDRKILSTSALRVVFAWTGDRWSHRVEVNAAGASGRHAHAGPSATDQPGETWFCVAASVEGGSDAKRVLSPAYQQFYWEPETQGGCGMLVGQSGPHHFSAVFSAAYGDGFVLEVDLADRCRAELETLACTYQVEALPGDLSGAGPGHAEWDLHERGILRLETIDPGGPVRIAVAEAGRLATRVQIGAPGAAGDSTHRLAYRWRYAEPGRRSS